MRSLVVALGLGLSLLPGCSCEGAAIADAWDFTWTVQRASGLCEGELGEVSTATIEIERGGDAAAVTLASFGDDEVSLEGTFVDGVLEFGGSYADDGGTTTSQTHLELSDDGSSLSGVEDWSWESDINPDACPDNRSTVTAMRSGA